MFHFTLRINKKAVLCGAVALGLFVSGWRALPRGAQPNDGSTPAAAEEPAADTAVARHLAFLAACGWTVASKPIAVEYVKIPTSFGEVYERYNRLQRAQGCDLMPYRGKTVTKYVYEVLSYPGAPADDSIRANVLEYGGELIGGDISSVRIDGFMHGFHGETDASDST